LLERIGLDFDLDHVPDGALSAFDRDLQPARNGDVIVLDENAVVEDAAGTPGAAPQVHRSRLDLRSSTCRRASLSLPPLRTGNTSARRRSVHRWIFGSCTTSMFFRSS